MAPPTLAELAPAPMFVESTSSNGPELDPRYSLQVGCLVELVTLTVASRSVHLVPAAGPSETCPLPLLSRTTGAAGLTSVTATAGAR
jgi:hypothetical protein